MSEVPDFRTDDSPAVFGGMIDATEALKKVAAEPFRFEKHDDDERFDRVEIVCVPRYKTSALSGDEWRVSALVRFYQKGRLVYERRVGDMETACKAVSWFEVIREEWNRDAFVGIDEQCFQPGCSENATVEYRFRKLYSKHTGEVEIDYDQRIAEGRYGGDRRIRFCERHARRGDCGLTDADENYVKTRVRTAAGWEAA